MNNNDEQKNLEEIEEELRKKAEKEEEREMKISGRSVFNTQKMLHKDTEKNKHE